MRAQAKRPRRIWPLILALVVVVIAVIATLATNAAKAPTTPGASPSESPSASASPTAVDAAPTGCLGGNSRDSAMILEAAKQASHDTPGAVSLAASFVRWIQRYPYPSVDEASAVEEGVLANPSFTDNLVSYLAAEPDLSGGIVPSGTTYYMNNLPGVWKVESASADQVVVSIGSGFVIDGALSSTLRSSITITLVWQDSQWRVANADGTRTPAELYQVGAPLEGGC
jgi:hypothetical protein